MSRGPRTLGRNDRLQVADDLMRTVRCRHLPVLDERGRLAGIVSQRDLFRALCCGRSDTAPGLATRCCLQSLSRRSWWRSPSWHQMEDGVSCSIPCTVQLARGLRQDPPDDARAAADRWSQASVRTSTRAWRSRGGRCRTDGCPGPAGRVRQRQLDTGNGRQQEVNTGQAESGRVCGVVSLSDCECRYLHEQR